MAKKRKLRITKRKLRRAVNNYTKAVNTAVLFQDLLEEAEKEVKETADIMSKLDEEVLKLEKEEFLCVVQ